MWLDREIIDQIIKYESAGTKLSGIRLYLARYKKGTGSAGSGDFPLNRLTIITAPTKAGAGTTSGGEPIHDDLMYLDYGKPCPPKCNGGI